MCFNNFSWKTQSVILIYISWDFHFRIQLVLTKPSIVLTWTGKGYCWVEEESTYPLQCIADNRFLQVPCFLENLISRRNHTAILWNLNVSHFGVYLKAAILLYKTSKLFWNNFFFKCITPNQVGIYFFKVKIEKPEQCVKFVQC